MNTLTLNILGRPSQQGNHSTNPHTHRVYEFSARLKPWRRAVKAAVAAAQEADPYFHPFDGAIRVAVVFYFERPKNHYRTGRYAHLLRDDAPLHCTSGSVPDLDKLVRALGDALGLAGVWADDRAITSWDAVKVWAPRSRHVNVGASVCISTMSTPAPWGQPGQLAEWGPVAPEWADALRESPGPWEMKRWPDAEN